MGYAPVKLDDEPEVLVQDVSVYPPTSIDG
jgi:hypothetical protein